MAQELWPEDSDQQAAPAQLAPPAFAPRLVVTPQEAPVPVAKPVVRPKIGWPIPVLSLLTIGLAIALAASLYSGGQTKSQLDSTTASLHSTESDLSAEKVTAAGFQATIAGLQAQVQTEGTCISQLGVASKQITAINAAEVDAYNLTAEGSVFATSRAARDAANSAAIDDYYNGFSEAWDGSLSTANSWISRGNTQLKNAETDLATMNAEIAKVNALDDQIAQMEADYSATNLATCNQPGSSPGTNS